MLNNSQINHIIMKLRRDIDKVLVVFNVKMIIHLLLINNIIKYVHILHLLK